MKSRCAERAGKAPTLGRIALAAFLLLEPACSSGSGAMVEKEAQKQEAKREVAGLVITKVSPVENCLSAIKQGNEENAKKIAFPFLSQNYPPEERKAVFDAFAAKFGADATAKATFDFLRESNTPKEQKYQIMDLFVGKYQGSALRLLYTKAVTDFGMDFNTSGAELVKDPARLSYMQSLAYGFAKFGAAGFIAAETLVANMDNARFFRIPIVSHRDTPLSGMLVYMVCDGLSKRGQINPEGAVDYLSKKYLMKKKGELEIPEAFKEQFGDSTKSGPSMDTKAVVVSMIRGIYSSAGKDAKAAFETLITNPQLDSEAKLLIEIQLRELASKEKR